MAQSPFPNSVTNGRIVLQFIQPSNHPAYPKLPVHPDQRISPELPLATNVLLVREEHAYDDLAQVGTNFFLIRIQDGIVPDIFTNVQTELQCRAILKWLHGGDVIGHRVERERFKEFIARHSDRLSSEHLRVATTNAPADWPARDFVLTNGVWMAHYILFLGGVEEFYHAVRTDGRIATMQRRLIDIDLPVPFDTGSPVLGTDEWDKHRAGNEVANALMNELRVTLDRGDK